MGCEAFLALAQDMKRGIRYTLKIKAMKNAIPARAVVY